MDTESTKALLRRWYDEMWFPRNSALVPELAGPIYTRHEFGASRQVTAEEYETQVRSLQETHEFTDMRYRLVGEDDHVVAIGTWLANGKLVETWLSGLHTESDWGPDVIRTI